MPSGVQAQTLPIREDVAHVLTRPAAGLSDREMSVECVAYTAQTQVKDEQRVADSFQYNRGDRVLVPYTLSRADCPRCPALRGQHPNCGRWRPSYVAGLVDLTNFSSTSVVASPEISLLLQRVKAHAIAKTSSISLSKALEGSPWLSYRQGDLFWIAPGNQQTVGSRSMASAGRNWQRPRMLNLRTGDCGAIENISDLLLYPHVVVEREEDLFGLDSKNNALRDMDITCRTGDYLTLGGETRTLQQRDIIFAINHRTNCMGFVRPADVRELTQPEIVEWMSQHYSPTELIPTLHENVNALMQTMLPPVPGNAPDCYGEMNIERALHFELPAAIAEWHNEYADGMECIMEHRERLEAEKEDFLTIDV